jgi:hypothetical protein
MPNKTPAPPATPPPRQLAGPSFGQPEATADPTTFVVKHPSDAPAYKAIDQLNAEHKIAPLSFAAPRGGSEPQLTFDQTVGNTTASAKILAAGQIVFHATGDCGSTSGPKTQNEVADKMVADFQESDPSEVPQFNFLLGDIVYSFGETQYYYDQFYEPYRNYPAPILAAAGNHDGMISPLAHAKSLDAYLRNFCSQGFVVTPEAGGLSRTAQIQPGVFFTFEAPFVRILTLYSNTLEDPGVIANATIGDSQLAYLDAALGRVKSQGYTGALLIASHHPAYTAGTRHGWSVEMQAQIDAACTKAGVWPHAVLAGHAHNYQRFTRTRPDKTQIPFVICGNGGHNVLKLTTGSSALRTPQVIQTADATHDQIVFENYDDTDYGYLRIVANAQQLRIEYHPASDGAGAKTPDDFVTVDLASRTLVHYVANDLGRPAAAAAVRNLRSGASGSQAQSTAQGKATTTTARGQSIAMQSTRKKSAGPAAKKRRR